MRFYSGLKKLLSERLYVFIIGYFVVGWFLVIVGTTFFQFKEFFMIVQILIGMLFGFSFLLLIISILKSPHEIKYTYLIVLFIAGIPFMLIFEGITSIFYYFSYYANIVLTAFFAFKICMDSAVKVDDYLRKAGSIHTVLRGIEFIVFIFLNWIIFRLTLSLFKKVGVIPNLVSLVFSILFWINIVFLICVVIRLAVTKEFASYSALFLVLIFIYMLYITIDFYAEIIFPNTTGYTYISFLVDLLLFLYILGSIFGRVDFLKDKMSFLKVDTIALFIIMMKLIVQANQLTTTSISYQDELGILSIFIIFIMLFGIYKISTYDYQAEL